VPVRGHNIEMQIKLMLHSLKKTSKCRILGLLQLIGTDTTHAELSRKIAPILNSYWVLGQKQQEKK
jgi:hypothetical protein